MKRTRVYITCRGRIFLIGNSNQYFTRIENNREMGYISPSGLKNTINHLKLKFIGYL